MLLVKISLYWLLPLNHASERLNSLEGIIYQKKITSEKNIKRKDSAFTQRSCTQRYRTHVNVKLLTLACLRNVQEELTKFCDKLGKGY